MYDQIISLFILAIPAACIAWTVTHEEIFREPREYCVQNSLNRKSVFLRKFFYVFTCEYCFSHYVVAIILLITSYKLVFVDWRGYFIAFFSLVWIANLYMSLFALLRMKLKAETLETNKAKIELDDLPNS